jgi:hypothetical protein
MIRSCRLPIRPRSAPKIVKDATPKAYYGAAHGMPLTLNDKIHADPIAFFHQGKQASA